jgi:hypothetical protein
VFSYMADVLAWCVVISFVAFGFAFAAEGRGVHVLRVLLGLAPRKQGLDALTSVPRDEGDWRLVEVLDDTRRPEPTVSGEVRRERVLPKAS